MESQCRPCPAEAGWVTEESEIAAATALMQAGRAIVAAMHKPPPVRLVRRVLAYFEGNGRRCVSPGKLRWLRRVSRRCR